MDKVSLLEAARSAGLHPNTVRNWRKLGKLNTVEKVVENKIEAWVVDPDEVAQLAQISRATNGFGRATNNPHDDVAPIGGPYASSGQDTTQPRPGAGPDSPGGQISPAFEQSLALIRESVVRPLVEANERQASKIEDLSAQVGTLQERVRQLEARLAESVPIHHAPAPQPVAAPVVEPSPVLNRETLQPVPPKKGFWARLFGG